MDRRWRCTLTLMSLGLLLTRPVEAKTFRCGAGDVACLTRAIMAANANGVENTIRLAAGTYTLTAINNGTVPFNSNGLPVVTGAVTITGAGAGTTILERAAAAPPFRLLQVAATGQVTLTHLTLLGGMGDTGGGILNEGTLTIHRCLLAEHLGDRGGALRNTGLLTLTDSTLRDNDAAHDGGGLLNDGGTVRMTNTAIVRNTADGAALDNLRGTVQVTNSTFALNTGTVSGAIFNVNVDTTLSLMNTTVVQNTVFASWVGSPGGLTNRRGTVIMQNTIMAHNNANLRSKPPFSVPVDCAGAVTSSGNNLIGDATGCSLTQSPGARDISPCCRPAKRSMQAILRGAPERINWGPSGSIPVTSARSSFVGKTSAATRMTLTPWRTSPRRAQAAPVPAWPACHSRPRVTRSPGAASGPSGTTCLASLHPVPTH